MRQLQGQMELNLFPASERENTREGMRDFCLDWLCRYHGCNRRDIAPVVKRLYEEFPSWEAFDRAKVLRHVNGKRKVRGWRVEDAEAVLGIFDHSIDYHVCWDRAQAAWQGVSKGDVARVIDFDYRRKVPVFA